MTLSFQGLGLQRHPDHGNPEREKTEVNPGLLEAKVSEHPEVDSGPPQQDKASVHPEEHPESGTN